MRKLKPKKERETKVNEKKEINVVEEPTLDRLNSLRFNFNIMNIITVIEKYQEVWKRDEGYLNTYYSIMLGRVKNLAKKINKEKFSNKQADIGNPYLKKVIVESMAICQSAFYKKPILTHDDKIENLPAGFMGTLGAWARIIKELDTAKMKKVANDYNVKNELLTIIDLSNKFMMMVAQDVIQNLDRFTKGHVFTKGIR